jgi:Sulfotransferase domain
MSTNGTKLGRRVDRQLRRRLPVPAYHFVRRRYYDARILVRRNPGRGRLLPDFLVIGAAKSGTTSLYGGLIAHPHVAPCITRDPHFGNTKEIHFFDYQWYRGEDWYRSHFPLERERSDFEREHGLPFLTGEASPPYLSHLWAPTRVRSMLPRVKLIAVLRDPVERAYSQFQMSRREGVEECESFEEAVAREEDRLRPEWERMAADPRYNSWNFGCWSYLARSRYAEQVERWLAFFPREQFFFVKTEDLESKPQAVLDGLYAFLDLPPYTNEGHSHLHVAPPYDPMPRPVRAHLAEYFRPHNERLYELVGIDFGWGD